MERVREIIERRLPLALSDDARQRIVRCREYLDRKMEHSDRPIYGITTGFGSLCNISIDHDSLAQLQRNLVMSHACGTGERVPSEVVRLILLLKIQSLAYGHSGVQLVTVERLVEFYNHDILPVVYQQGSLGASGDLAPLAHMSLPLLGLGEVEFRGEVRPAADVLREMGYPERSLEEMRRFVGNGAEMQIRRAVPEGTSEENIRKALTAYRAYYEEHCRIKTKVYDGLPGMLCELKKHGVKTAVVSNKPDAAVKKLSCEYFGDQMDYAIGASDGVRCKPYPDMVEAALRALGAEKKDAVFVGDSEVDVQTGLNAGLPVIAVSWGFRPREVVIAAGAEKIADNASELKQYILE